MAHRSWRDAVVDLDVAVQTATQEQQELAAFAGLTMAESIPEIVAAALLKVALADRLHLRGAFPATEEQVEWIDDLRGDDHPPARPETAEEAGAWIRYLLLTRRRKKLAELQLQEGDIVALPGGDVAEITSIGSDGRLYFKGGHEFGAWPDRVTLVARHDEEGDVAAEARDKARNGAARRQPRLSWSSAKHADLAEFEVPGAVDDNGILMLESVIDSAEDERPVQKHLEGNPHLLVAVLTGRDRYCIPQKRLGGEFIPDFIIGDVDSLGIQWLLVELESPRAPMYLKNGTALRGQAQKGVNQIVQWRNWLSANIAYARSPRGDKGLGLFDIREKTRGLVLVGRRASLSVVDDAVRRELRQSNNIEVHTYDWLLDALRSTLSFQGPLRTNRLLLPREDE